MPQSWGVTFQEVTPDSPAEALGIQPGDIVSSINGIQDPNMAQLRGTVQSASELSLVLERNGERVNVQTPWPPEGAEQPLLGVVLAPLEIGTLPPISYGAALAETTGLSRPHRPRVGYGHRWQLRLGTLRAAQRKRRGSGRHRDDDRASGA